MDAVGLLERLKCGSINGNPYVMVDDAKFVIEQILSEEQDTLKSGKQILGYLDRMLLEKEDWTEDDPVYKALIDLRNYITIF